MKEDLAYQQLQLYTLEHDGEAFIHQHVVDAWAAQHASAASKPMGVVFALIGLCLYLEHDFDGRQVQRMHMDLAKQRREWPPIPLAAKDVEAEASSLNKVTVVDVLAAPAGESRDRRIRDWCADVWRYHAAAQPLIRNLLQQHGIEPPRQ